MDEAQSTLPNVDEAEHGFVIALEDAGALLEGAGDMPFAVVAGREQPPMSAMLYAPRGADHQKPHDRNELYVVVSGHGLFDFDGQNRAFKTGDLIYVVAHTPHKFAEFSDDFCAWVIFYGDKVAHS